MVYSTSDFVDAKMRTGVRNKPWKSETRDERRERVSPFFIIRRSHTFSISFLQREKMSVDALQLLREATMAGTAVPEEGDRCVATIFCGVLPSFG